MTLGPLEYILIGFEGNRFTGQILPELRAVQEKGIIRVIDLLFLMKDANGAITTMELRDLREEEARRYRFLATDLLNILESDDVEAAATNMPNNSAAAFLLIEHTWAVHLKEAIINAGGAALAGGLVTPAVVQTLEAELAQAAKPTAGKDNPVAKAAG
jgi:Family of unknown function (DUF6325)